MDKTNPNGLTDEQIAARPEPFVGMVFFTPTAHVQKLRSRISWRIADDNWVAAWGNGKEESWQPNELLLPGEPGCPWPPPEEMRREWQEGDQAWIRIAGQWDVWTCDSIVQPGHAYWRRTAPIEEPVDGGVLYGFNRFQQLKDTPALYIPPESEE
jgi:hypothetical protein